MGRLQWIIHQDVDNPVSQLVVSEVLNDEDPEPWPGITVQTSTDPGKALVGCPNGYGVGYMLAQNTASLGHKTIDSVVVFADTYQNECLAYHIEGAAEDEDA